MGGLLKLLRWQQEGDGRRGLLQRLHGQGQEEEEGGKGDAQIPAAAVVMFASFEIVKLFMLALVGHGSVLR